MHPREVQVNLDLYLWPQQKDGKSILS